MVVNCAAYAEGQRVADLRLEDVSEAIARPGQFVWIGLHDLGNFSLVSVRQNEITKKLAGWAAIVAVPTMIAGIWGMNFHHMPELDWRLGYPLALVMMGGACAYLYWRFKQEGWL